MTNKPCELRASGARLAEYHLGGMTNTYPSGPKKGQETGAFSILLNPSAGMNKMMAQLIEPFAFDEKPKSASASPSPSHSHMPVPP